ncbi:hypothetical protein K488DRAFT_86549 [Vararia minispora EC-137]|uniref:Uncharacterized protein n=1 Tax=Vararia minispora EC-137 TaxID=1314806 RepID=A0ACB8QJ93_9AGAM|nr:hypothetical protein K488DRAFT_86549 [Vararia minispora EC-137]
MEDLNSDLDKIDSSRHAELVSEVNCLSDVPLHLKTRLNSCAPLLRLPEEILREIVTHTEEVWPAHYDRCCVSFSFRKQLRSLGWIAVGHVCHQLRLILLQQQLLWSKNVCAFPDVEREFLRRSGQLPLELELQNDTCRHTKARIDFVKDNFSRASQIKVQRISATATSTVLDNGWTFDPADLSGVSFPFLEVLNLDFTQGSDYAVLFTAESVYDLPPINSPRLQSLRFAFFYVPFDARTLLSLSLSRPSEWPFHPPSHFFEMLQSCIKLRSLRLDKWIPDIPYSAQKTISLPSLTDVEVVDQDERCLALWSHLSLPSLRRCHSTAFVLSPEVVDSESYIDSLARCFTPILSAPIYSASLSGMADCLHIQLFTSPPVECPENSFTSLRSDYTTALTFDFVSVYRLHFMRAVERLLGVIDTARLVCLHLADTDPYERSLSCSPERWKTLLLPLRHVHTLAIEGQEIGTLCSALTIPSGEFTSPPLPSLRSFSLTAARLRSTSLSDDIPRADANTSGISRDELMEMLSSRKRADIALKRLKIERVIVDKGESHDGLLAQLADLVSYVDCSIETVVGERSG